MSRAFDRALFHGTLAHIDKIDVMQGKPRKDFGRGFYLALSAEQAIGMMHKKLREATRRSRWSGGSSSFRNASLMTVPVL